MVNRRMMCFLTIFQIVSGHDASVKRASFLKKLVSRAPPKSHEFAAVAASREDMKCNYKCMPSDGGMPRSADGGTNDTAEYDELDPSPSGKFSIFNLFSEDEESENENDDNDTVEKRKDEEEEEEEEEDDMDFFGSDEEIKSDEPEGTKGESFLKQYHRHNLRLHSFVFPLLMAYKLKFFTVIPLLLGALVLLVGTTGIAGFFFALFAAALGIRVKSHDQ